MKQIILTIGVAVLALGGALVAVFYQQTAYSDSINALKNRTTEATAQLDVANVTISELRDELTAAQKAVSEAAQGVVVNKKLYSNDQLGLSFAYPDSYTIREELAEDPTVEPGGVIILESGDQSPSLEILVNPGGTGFVADKLAIYKRAGTSYILDSLIKTEDSTMSSDGVAVAAQLPFSDSLASEEQNIEQGMTILFRTNGDIWTSEKVLYDLISSIRLSR